MKNQELINQTLVAASIAKASGFDATYEALIDMVGEMKEASSMLEPPHIGQKCALPTGKFMSH